MDYITAHRPLLPLSFVVSYIIVFSICYTDVFCTLYNISSVLLELSVPIIMVIGMTLVLITKEIDLSLGYNVMFANVMVGFLVVLQLPAYLAIIITLLCSCLIGLIVGLLVTRAGVNSFIATLAAGLIYYGVGLFLFTYATSLKINGEDILHLPARLTIFGQYQFVEGLNFQIPIVYALVICLIALYFVTKTKYFSQYYYVGANNSAALLSGIKSKSIKTTAFIISAVLASFGGVIMAARLGISGSAVGLGWELQVITAAVIGGVSLTGGVGSMAGAFAGTLFMICLNNGMRIAEVSTNIYKIVYGAVLLIAVIVDTLFSRRKVVG